MWPKHILLYPVCVQAVGRQSQLDGHAGLLFRLHRGRDCPGCLQNGPVCHPVPQFQTTGGWLHFLPSISNIVFKKITNRLPCIDAVKRHFQKIYF